MAAVSAIAGPRTLRVLLVKPYQPCPAFVCSPPLGLLYLAAQLRQALADRVEVRFIDAKLSRRAPGELLDDYAWADVVGISALNFEARASFATAALVKRLDPHKLVALGGPLAHNRAVEVLNECAELDWVFDGEADRTFPAALRRRLDGDPIAGGVAGLYCRRDGAVMPPPANDWIGDLDALPFPAWDLVDFDAYARAPNMNVYMKGTRYAPLFTSRGCPYRCSYCHDIFTKKFRWRSAADVVAEVALLAERYRVDEFQVVDDIFNLHKPRVREIFAAIERRCGPRRFHFCFPNGLRADILDRDTVAAIRRGGGYQVTIAVETATPRLQHLIQKNLDVAKVEQFIRDCHAEGLAVKGFFMLGFPTETLRELWGTIRLAWRSKLTIASFFTVVPQPGTPLFELAKRENPGTIRDLQRESYFAKMSWYQQTYGYPLALLTIIAYVGFFFRPDRLWRLLKLVGARNVHRFAVGFLSVLVSFDFFSLPMRLRVGLRRLRAPRRAALAADRASPSLA